MALALALCGCTGAPTTPPASPTTSITPTATPSTTPTPDPTLRADLGAAENLAYFDFVNEKTLAAHPQPVGRDFIDALVAAGFSKPDMQVTADKTTINLVPGSIQFSVRFNGQCLIGQYGADGVGYHSEVTKLVSTGNCLIGDTSPINW
ncbi:DUF6993 domain-containing protein [Rathayibacter soli]|uniref:DUF6993 domain-containing protein n=1 Tax=Rathayibacter soli TaxID=3144168 RepID=UPI0027E51064|nr:hypothetical protein [Glaciibacter superstes]